MIPKIQIARGARAMVITLPLEENALRLDVLKQGFEALVGQADCDIRRDQMLAALADVMRGYPLLED